MDSQIFQLPWHLTDNLEQVERNGGEVGGRDAKQENYNSSTIRHCSVWHLQCPASTSCCQKEWSLHPKLYYWISFALWRFFDVLFTFLWPSYPRVVQCSYRARSNSSAKTFEWKCFKPALISATFLNGTQANFTTEPNILLCHRKVFVEIKVQRQSGVSTAQMISCWQRAL